MAVTFNVYKCLCFVFIATLACAAQDFEVKFNKPGDYNVIVNGQIWMTSAGEYIQADGRMWFADQGTLKYENTTYGSGKDKHGVWQSMSFHYQAGRVPMIFTLRQYVQQSSSHAMAVLEQYFPEGVNGTDTGNPNYVCTAFPRLNVGGQQMELGYLNYGGMMVGDTTRWMDRWTKNTKNLRTGIPGGPLVLFDKMSNVIIISPFNEFMAANMVHTDFVGGTVSWGVMGSVKSIPRGYRLKTIIYYGGQGINKAFEGWGTVLRKEYNKDDTFLKADFVNNYLGYWTDNGTVYWYRTEKNKTIEETLLDVYEDAKTRNIPYRYIQYDSWFYPHGPLDGVTAWAARNDTFRNGMRDIFKKTGWPAIAHNRWWSAWTPYAKKNGGNFNFIVEHLKSIPNDEEFWDWLFSMSKEWGLITYEQDWMSAQFLGLKAFKNDISLGKKWLENMGKAAAKHDITIQYCMSYPRHALQSLTIPTVTQARVTDDYEPGAANWRVGVTSIFAHALGLAPYKDSFWTRHTQPLDSRKEPNPALHALISTLTTGPIGPGDAVGHADVDLLMRCCNQDGLILKPSKPVTAIDDQIVQSAFSYHTTDVTQEIWTTYTNISGMVFGMILAVDVDDFILAPRQTGFQDQDSSAYIFRYNSQTVKDPGTFTDDSPVHLTNCTKLDFCYYLTSTSLTIEGNKIIIYGEINKWVPMSPQRISAIEYDEDEITIRVKGAVGEIVSFGYYKNSVVTILKCKLSETGVGYIRLLEETCSSIETS